MTILDFERVTDQILAIDMTDDVDIIIDKFTKLIDKRDEIIKAIDNKSDLKPVDPDLLNKIVSKNLAIESKFNEVLLLLQDKITGVQKEKTLSSLKKKAHRGYMNVGKQIDGYFIDKKK